MSQIPILIRILILTLWMWILPMAVGGLFSGNKLFEKHRGPYGIFMWVSGQFVLWGLFQIVCVPFILLQMDFKYVVAVYLAAAGLLAVVGAFVWHREGFGKSHVFLVQEGAERHKDITTGVYWAVFVVLLIFQLVQVVRLAYGDGDDAYYVAVSTITENAETMYQKLPYTGGSTELDVRHGLAPFPIWIAFLAQISGVPTVSVAHVAAPFMLIPMTYMIFYLFGSKLFATNHRQLPVFLIFTELLILFGDYSFYTVENFMLARSRQGKAALGSIVIPMVFLLLYLCMERMEERAKCGWSYWLLMLCAMLTGCLCSTMGAFLLCMLLAVVGLCIAVCYRRWKILVPLALCCVPCGCFALIYVMN